MLGHVPVYCLAHADTGGEVVALVEDGYARVGGAGDTSAIDFTLP